MRKLILAAVALAACADAATAPLPTSTLEVIPASQTMVVAASATLASTHVTAADPVEYWVDLGQVIDPPLVQVEYELTFGDDALDGGECVYFFDELTGSGTCNPAGASPLTSTVLTITCANAWLACNSLEDGRSNGRWWASALDYSDASFDLTDVRVRVTYARDPGKGRGPAVLSDQFGGATGSAVNGRRLATGGGMWLASDAVRLAHQAAWIRMELAPWAVDYDECQGPTPNEDLCYTYGAMTLMLDHPIRTRHEIVIRIHDLQPDQALAIWTSSDPGGYQGTFLWLAGGGLWAISPEGDLRVPSADLGRGDYTLRIFDVDFATHRYSLEVVGKLTGGGLVRGVLTGIAFTEPNMRALAITLQADPGKTRGTYITGVTVVTR